MTLKELDAFTACLRSHTESGPCLSGGEAYEEDDKKEKARFWAEAELARLALVKAYKAKGYTVTALKESFIEATTPKQGA